MPGKKMSKYMAKGGKYMSKMAKGGKYMSKMAKGGKYMAKGGVAGNDFGLSNNQIAVKDNSGTLTGVSIGTAGQALKVNSGANGYEFGTISSDYEKVANGTITNSQNWDFASSNFDGSTYKYFDFHIEVQHHSGTQLSLIHI